jgi:ribosomal protein S18 acetylase RimI-like enzyme
MTFATLTAEDIASLERATLDAVAPQDVIEYGDWLVPFDTSTIGRARSAVPLRHAGVNPSSVQPIVERYASRSLNAAFRMADIAGMAEVHSQLSSMGFRAEQPTLVQVGTVASMRLPGSTGDAVITEAPTEAWRAVYLGEGFDLVDGAHRIAALSRSNYVIYASIVENGVPVASGTAAFSQGWASIHGMRTALSHRGRGLAGNILHSLANAALERGLHRVFLQVEEDNSAARALYQRAGFTTAWRYHYWRLATLVRPR